MNRIIKFRCFEEHSNTMHQNCFFKITKQKNIVWFSENGDILEECEAMQFTGVTDKNGTEIFEGDVLKGNKIGYVCFNNGKYIIKYKNDSNFIAFKNYFEVIGNIHQNPELLA